MGVAISTAQFDSAGEMVYDTEARRIFIWQRQISLVVNADELNRQKKREKRSIPVEALIRDAAT